LNLQAYNPPIAGFEEVKPTIFSGKMSILTPIKSKLRPLRLVALRPHQANARSM